MGCALSSSHPTAQAFRFPCSACAAVGCALPRLQPMYRDLRCCAVRTPLWAARCLHRIRQPKHFVCIAVLHPTAQDLRCLAMHDFFSIGLLVSYRFMFFFIDWKLPPPACPGTTGILLFSKSSFVNTMYTVYSICVYNICMYLYIYIYNHIHIYIYT